MQASRQSVLVTCEHGGNNIPPAWQYLFRNARRVLQSHRGWDKGALELARELAAELRYTLIAAETSRLLIDLNRSLKHQSVFSEFTRDCDVTIKQRIIEEVYLPYRNRLEAEIEACSKKQKRVVHFSIHSFIPQLHGHIRNTDIGLLYNPQRVLEKSLCVKLQESLKEMMAWRVRRNYPYRGITDGLTTSLRKKYSNTQYCGIEIEINQKIVPDRKRWNLLKQSITNAIKKTL